MPQIKIVAPLAAAGEFPVAHAEQIWLNSNQPVEEAVQELQDAVQELQDAMGLTPSAPGSSSSPSLSTKIDSLRDYITTLLPPPLTAKLSNSTVYLIGSTPNDLKINVSINCPLEPPLKLVIDGETVATTETKEGVTKPLRSWNKTWAPRRDSIGSTSTEVAIVDENDSDLKYVSKLVSCNFSAPVYYWIDSTKLDTLAAIPDNAKSNKDKLTVSHPTSVSFGATNHYCYYACPAAFTTQKEPSFFIGGVNQTSGFTKLKTGITKNINDIDILYSIYRTNNALSSSVEVNIT